MKQRLAADPELLQRLAFSPDGASVAGGGSAGQIKLWEVGSGQERWGLPGQGGRGVTGLVFSPDGDSLASVGEEPWVMLWEVASGRLRQVLVGHSEAVAALARYYDISIGDLLVVVDEVALPNKRSH